MNQFLKKAFVLFVLFSSISVFAQKGNYDKEPSMPFQPMFSFGMAYHSFQGDIMGPATNTLLGNMGYRAGMRFNISENLDASLLFSNTSFYEENDEASFQSDVDAVGLHLGYTLNSVFKQSRISPYFTTGVQVLSFKTLNTANQPKWTEIESTIAIPLGLGLRLNISERIDLDATFNYTIAMADIDKLEGGTADKFLSASFTLHYDLFTPKPKENTYFDDSYYADVNFKAMDVEDEDGDLVADVDDYCPKTPIGVKVNQFGCPLDGDNDGIPDYIDQEKNTRSGAVVDEKGVQLTDEKYHSMYSDYEAASREYANFYNENEIKRENYKTIDEYLIAKANAFNKAYNEGEEFNNTVAGLKYKVKVGEFSDGVPANVINKYLSLDDLESISQDNGVVIYTVGTYNTLNDALGREIELEAKGFNETSILVDNNGAFTDYVIPTPDPVIDEDEIVVAPPISEEILYYQDQYGNDSLDINDNRIRQEGEQVAVPSNEMIYRVQIGFYKKELSYDIFKGLSVTLIRGDGGTYYYTGAFTEHQDALIKCSEMKARGHKDAFIVTYKHGERISLHVAIKTEKKARKIKAVVEDEEVKLNVKFTVQILVAKELLSSKELKKMTPLGKIDKKPKGQEMYRYVAGTYSSLEDANTRLAEAKLAGFSDAFIFATLDGERITLKRAKRLLQ